ncbi:hypothetical protein PoB_004638700 [Plakobranchus ocellatus]|uniref:Uncharacterized protein n=1 Tax=Plakobranchus ocellatus TaxID=259542 RepID=A0AAV4BKP5_9GAST|nr:hypothetical protein PoB_004638700 [Plakobranchus ocellatus]
MERKDKERQWMQRNKDNMNPQKWQHVNEKRMRQNCAAKAERLTKGQRVQKVVECEAPVDTIEVVGEDDNGVVTIEPLFTDEGDCVQV